MHLTDLIEERAAILEYDAGLPRDVAQNKAAQMHGFKDWREYDQRRTTRSN
jgi:hypothetical protein